MLIVAEACCRIRKFAFCAVLARKTANIDETTAHVDALFLSLSSASQLSRTVASALMTASDEKETERMEKKKRKTKTVTRVSHRKAETRLSRFGSAVSTVEIIIIMIGSAVVRQRNIHFTQKYT